MDGCNGGCGYLFRCLSGGKVRFLSFVYEFGGGRVSRCEVWQLESLNSI